MRKMEIDANPKKALNREMMSHLVCNQLKKVFIFLEEKKSKQGSIPAHFIINEREFFVKKEGDVLSR
jgi:hypothetical protein